MGREKTCCAPKRWHRDQKMTYYRAGFAAWLLVHGIDGFSLPRIHSHSHYSPGNGIKSQQSTGTVLKSAAISSNEDLKPGIAIIDAANEQLMEQLDQLRQTQNFRLYSVDILASCEYMPQELFECYSETCEIYPVDEEEVRVVFQTMISCPYYCLRFTCFLNHSNHDLC